MNDPQQQPMPPSLAARVAAPPRPVNTFTVPPKIGGDVKTVGMVEITPDEEMAAGERSRGERGRMAYELAKASLAEVNGQRVNIGDGTVDEWFTKMGPVVRSLVMQAYLQLHSAEEADAASFFTSRTTRVG